MLKKMIFHLSLLLPISMHCSDNKTQKPIASASSSSSTIAQPTIAHINMNEDDCSTWPNDTLPGIVTKAIFNAANAMAKPMSIQNFLLSDAGQTLRKHIDKHPKITQICNDLVAEGAKANKISTQNYMNEIYAKEQTQDLLDELSGKNKKYTPEQVKQIHLNRVTRYGERTANQLSNPESLTTQQIKDLINNQKYLSSEDLWTLAGIIRMRQK